MSKLTRKELELDYLVKVLENIQINERASIKSEENFKELYAEKLEQYLDGEYAYATIDNFDSSVVQWNLDFYNRNLPQYIKDSVLDLRILALDCVTEETYKKVQEFIIVREERMIQKRIEFRTMSTQVSESCKNFMYLGMNDALIQKAYIELDNFCIQLKNAENKLYLVKFKGYSIKKQDGLIENDWGVSEEFTWCDGKLEYNLICLQSQIVLLCDDIEFIKLGKTNKLQTNAHVSCLQDTSFSKEDQRKMTLYDLDFIIEIDDDSNVRIRSKSQDVNFELVIDNYGKAQIAYSAEGVQESLYLEILNFNEETIEIHIYNKDEFIEVLIDGNELLYDVEKLRVYSNISKSLITQTSVDHCFILLSSALAALSKAGIIIIIEGEVCFVANEFMNILEKADCNQ